MKYFANSPIFGHANKKKGLNLQKNILRFL